MEPLLGIISITALILSTLMLCRIIKPEKPVSFIAWGFLVLTGQIVVIAFILSALNLLSYVYYWTAFNVSIFLLVLGTTILNGNYRRSVFKKISIREGIIAIKRWHRELPQFEKVILTFLIIIVLIINIINFAVVISTAPHTWDGMALFLARAAHFLQRNNISYYDAGYVQQLSMQKNSEILMIYALVVSGYNENLTQLIQFIAYWIAAIVVYGISREIGLNRSAGLFAALVFSLLIECIMQSTTVRNDMLITAYIGSITYALFAFKNSRKRNYLIMAGMGIGLSLGVKASMVVVFPSLIVIAVTLMFLENHDPFISNLKSIALLIVVSIFFIGIFALPAGYLENQRVFGHPLGPKSFRELHSFKGQDAGYIISNGTKHLLKKYGFDILALDGLPPIKLVKEIQSWIRYIPKTFIMASGIDLQDDQEFLWTYDMPPYSHEDYSSLGVFGFAFLWPVMFLSILGIIKSPYAKVLSIAMIMFIFMHAYSGGYVNGGRGRWAIYGAVFISPLAGYLFLAKNVLLRVYLSTIIAIGCLAGLTSVLFRYRSPILTSQSVFLQDRITQILRDAPVFQKPITSFEEIVPPGVMVATCINENSYEYPLFGYKLTRTIIPLNSFCRGLQPVPEEADYLLWADDFDEIFNRRRDDIHLGKDWWLRKLR